MAERDTGKSLTALRRERFEDLVRQSEKKLKEEPNRYRYKLLRLTLLGYGVIFVVVMPILGFIGLILIGAVFASGWILWLFSTKVAWVLIGVVAVLLKSIWVRLPPPHGKPITHLDTPGLFDDIAWVRAKAKTPEIHEVRLSDEFNAWVIQIPRWGITGSNRNYLILGLPLMLALTRDQMRAVNEELIALPTTS